MNTMSNILLDAPNVGRLEKEYLCKAVDSGFVSAVGPLVGTFEEEFARSLGARAAVATQSGTAALYMALHEAGVGKGDEVIVPALTFAATIAPVVQLSATPVIVDVDRETWNISPDAVEQYMTRKTKAVIPVHVYGNPCDMRRLQAIARAGRVAVIEDATESLGATYRGKATGTFGDFGCFSFNGNKLITTGGGGMIVGKSMSSLKHIKYLINQAKDVRDNATYHNEVGFNYRMTNIEGALGLAQLKQVDDFLRLKHRYHAAYARRFMSLDTVTMQQEYPSARSSWWLNGIVLSGGQDKAAVQARLERQGIPTRRLFVPLSECAPYKKYRRGSVANARYLFERGLCLPSSTCNDPAVIEQVADAVARAVR